MTLQAIADRLNREGVPTLRGGAEWRPSSVQATIGHLHGRGKESGARVESPIGYVIDFKNGKAVRYRDYFDPNEALQAAGLQE